ncbi:hypothetical protein [Flavobacterium hydatis]|uniref:Uncharacterized protein n=1 Tax=Flavobacterium hydatis TaxID=991 RepID=A0A085ZZ28_FLAHY|nr:hypothetical protein [Flavobacterium hydatis]KFF09692.1 hypothetical protein IW20_22670 [Flavobacterium hydatis]OXA91445.1 hypothetical protein B0A62_17360 [Flavobacterium hydatis]
MKIIINIALVLFYTLLVFFAVIWFLAHGSGHEIPLETDLSIAGFIVLDILVILVLRFAKKRISKDE